MVECFTVMGIREGGKEGKRERKYKKCNEDGWKLVTE